ncbi:hypothetical protein WH47_03453 [Habropoda laboriosa]|uniref:Uncharacterized protein n=1 Tax=Habropoda laboriosa TaxID=597456 RepID=A0A0L7RBW7_9HYME|nr:hypothetical protein WH47_03453 [Habropoda laboriosa]
MYEEERKRAGEEDSIERSRVEEGRSEREVSVAVRSRPTRTNPFLEDQPDCFPSDSHSNPQPSSLDEGRVPNKRRSVAPTPSQGLTMAGRLSDWSRPSTSIVHSPKDFWSSTDPSAVSEESSLNQKEREKERQARPRNFAERQRWEKWGGDGGGCSGRGATPGWI